MASNTGAPWLLPYPEDTDLVRDGADDIEALATAVASGLTAANSGIGTNVVSTRKDNAFSTTSATFVDVTGLAVTITPSTATKKVLVIANVSVGHDTGDFLGLRLTNAADEAIAGLDPTTGFDSLPFFVSGSELQKQTIVVLHSPATASPFTYKVRMRTSASPNAAYVNRNSGTSTSTSSITAIEVSA
jgi:hypothetical protein